MPQRYIYTIEDPANEEPTYTPEDVKVWQKKLKAVGYVVKVNGSFDKATKLATKKYFQEVAPGVIRRGEVYVPEEEFRSAFFEYPPMVSRSMSPGSSVIPEWEKMSDMEYFYDHIQQTYCIVRETEYTKLDEFNSGFAGKLNLYRTQAFSYMALEHGKANALSEYRSSLYLDSDFYISMNSPPVVSYRDERSLDPRPGSRIKVLIRVSGPHFDAIPGTPSSALDYQRDSATSVHWIETTNGKIADDFSQILRAFKEIEKKLATSDDVKIEKWSFKEEEQSLIDLAGLSLAAISVQEELNKKDIEGYPVDDVSSQAEQVNDLGLTFSVDEKLELRSFWYVSEDRDDLKFQKMKCTPRQDDGLFKFCSENPRAVHYLIKSPKMLEDIKKGRHREDWLSFLLEYTFPALEVEIVAEEWPDAPTAQMAGSEDELIIDDELRKDQITRSSAAKKINLEKREGTTAHVGDPTFSELFKDGTKLLKTSHGIYENVLHRLQIKDLVDELIACMLGDLADPDRFFKELCKEKITAAIQEMGEVTFLGKALEVLQDTREFSADKLRALSEHLKDRQRAENRSNARLSAQQRTLRSGGTGRTTGEGVFAADPELSAQYDSPSSRIAASESYDDKIQAHATMSMTQGHAAEVAENIAGKLGISVDEFCEKLVDLFGLSLREFWNNPDEDQWANLKKNAGAAANPPPTTPVLKSNPVPTIFDAMATLFLLALREAFLAALSSTLQAVVARLIEECRDKDNQPRDPEDYGATSLGDALGPVDRNAKIPGGPNPLKDALTLGMLKDMLSDLSKLLTPGEICDLLEGSASAKLLEFVRQYILARFPEISENPKFGSSFSNSDVRELFSIIAQMTDVGLCRQIRDDIDGIIVGSDSVCPPEEFRCSLLEGRGTPEEIRAICDEQEQRRIKAISDLLDLRDQDNLLDGLADDINDPCSPYNSTKHNMGPMRVSNKILVDDLFNTTQTLADTAMRLFPLSFMDLKRVPLPEELLEAAMPGQTEVSEFTLNEEIKASFLNVDPVFNRTEDGYAWQLKGGDQIVEVEFLDLTPGDDITGEGILKQDYIFRIYNGSEATDATKVYESEMGVLETSLEALNPDLYSQLDDRLLDSRVGGMHEAFVVGMCDKFASQVSSPELKRLGEFDPEPRIPAGGLYKQMREETYGRLVSLTLDAIGEGLSQSYYLDEKKLLALDLVPDFCFRTDIEFDDLNDPATAIVIEGDGEWTADGDPTGYKDGRIRQILGRGDPEQEDIEDNVIVMSPQEARRLGNPPSGIRVKPVRGTLVGNEIVKKQIMADLGKSFCAENDKQKKRGPVRTVLVEGMATYYLRVLALQQVLKSFFAITKFNMLESVNPTLYVDYITDHVQGTVFSGLTKKEKDILLETCYDLVKYKASSGIELYDFSRGKSASEEEFFDLQLEEDGTYETVETRELRHSISELKEIHLKCLRFLLQEQVESVFSTVDRIFSESGVQSGSEIDEILFARPTQEEVEIVETARTYDLSVPTPEGDIEAGSVENFENRYDFIGDAIPERGVFSTETFIDVDYDAMHSGLQLQMLRLLTAVASNPDDGAIRSASDRNLELVTAFNQVRCKLYGKVSKEDFMEAYNTLKRTLFQAYGNASVDGSGVSLISPVPQPIDFLLESFAHADEVANVEEWDDQAEFADNPNIITPHVVYTAWRRYLDWMFLRQGANDGRHRPYGIDDDTQNLKAFDNNRTKGIFFSKFTLEAPYISPDVLATERGRALHNWTPFHLGGENQQVNPYARKKLEELLFIYSPENADSTFYSDDDGVDLGLEKIPEILEINDVYERVAKLMYLAYEIKLKYRDPQNAALRPRWNRKYESKKINHWFGQQTLANGRLADFGVGDGPPIREGAPAGPLTAIVRLDQPAGPAPRPRMNPPCSAQIAPESDASFATAVDMYETGQAELGAPGQSWRRRSDEWLGPDGPGRTESERLWIIGAMADGTPHGVRDRRTRHPELVSIPRHSFMKWPERYMNWFAKYDFDLPPATDLSAGGEEGFDFRGGRDQWAHLQETPTMWNVQPHKNHIFARANVSLPLYESILLDFLGLFPDSLSPVSGEQLRALNTADIHGRWVVDNLYTAMGEALDQRAAEIPEIAAQELREWRRGHSRRTRAIHERQTRLRLAISAANAIAAAALQEELDQATADLADEMSALLDEESRIEAWRLRALSDIVHDRQQLPYAFWHRVDDDDDWEYEGVDDAHTPIHSDMRTEQAVPDFALMGTQTSAGAIRHLRELLRGKTFMGTVQDGLNLQIRNREIAQAHEINRINRLIEDSVLPGLFEGKLKYGMRFLYTTKSNMGTLSEQLLELPPEARAELFELYAKEKAWVEVDRCVATYPAVGSGQSLAVNSVEFGNKIILPLAETSYDVPRDWHRVNNSGLNYIERGMAPEQLRYMFRELKDTREFKTYLKHLVPTEVVVAMYMVYSNFMTDKHTRGTEILFNPLRKTILNNIIMNSAPDDAENFIPEDPTVQVLGGAPGINNSMNSSEQNEKELSDLFSDIVPMTIKNLGCLLQQMSPFDLMLNPFGLLDPMWDKICKQQDLNPSAEDLGREDPRSAFFRRGNPEDTAGEKLFFTRLDEVKGSSEDNFIMQLQLAAVGRVVQAVSVLHDSVDPSTEEGRENIQSILGAEGQEEDEAAADRHMDALEEDRAVAGLPQLSWREWTALWEEKYQSLRAEREAQEAAEE